MRAKLLTLALSVSLLTPISFGALASETISLTDKQISRLGITATASLSAGNMSLANVPAKIIPVRTSLKAITIPYEGVLTKIHVLPSQEIKAGQTLFTVRSRDYMDMNIGLQAAKGELEVANIALKQQTLLVDEGLVAGTTLLPLKANVMRAQALVDEYQTPLRGIHGAGLSQYYIKAPESGRIEDFDLQIGQSVEPMSAVTAIYTSDDLWAEVMVPEKLVGQVKAGDSIGFDDGSFGEVVSASRMIDPKTKSAMLVAKVPAGSGLNPGQLTQVIISKSSQAGEMVRVPVSAIIRLNGKTNVFLKSSGGFTPIAVEVTGRSRGYATIAGTVIEGDQVAVTGLTELKAMHLAGAE
ncbi:MAG: efflux RND transporter periplasmic adaptor subunit [Robiginitomaculum sp.]|nr:efflux RND transporter periplasmic adaptor subunit [Robiginitomaculum sp.]